MRTDERTNGQRDTDRQTYGREGNRRFRDYTDTSKNFEVVSKKSNLGEICFYVIHSSQK